MVKQLTFGGIGGIDEIEPQHLASLKYDGSQYTLHILDYKVIGLTSKRISKKTNRLNDKLHVFPQLKDMRFPYKKYTAITCEVASEHLKHILREDRCGYVAGIMNSSVSTLKEKFPAKKGFSHDLRLIAISVEMMNGVDVSELSWNERISYLKVFPEAGFYGEFVGKDTNLIYRLTYKKVGEIVGENKFNYRKLLQDKVNKPSFDYEGFVMIDPKSSLSCKVKKEKTADVIVIGYDWNSTGKYKKLGWIRSVVVGVTVVPILKFSGCTSLSRGEVSELIKLKKIVKCGKVSGMTEQIREKFSKSPNANCGKVIEVEYMNWTGKAMRHPRFKRFRTDKDITRCILSQFKER